MRPPAPRRIISGTPGARLINTRICGKCSVIRLFLLTLIFVYALAVVYSLRSAIGHAPLQGNSLQGEGNGDDDRSSTVDSLRSSNHDAKIPHFDNEDFDEEDLNLLGASSDLDKDMNSPSNGIHLDPVKDDTLNKRAGNVNDDTPIKSVAKSEDEPSEEPAPEVLVFDDNTNKEDTGASEAEAYLERIRPKNKVRRLLDSLRSNHEERHRELNSQPDYRHPVYVKENTHLIEEMDAIPAAEVSLRQSLRLITRLGHRRRVTDMIGGIPMTPEDARRVISNETSVMDRQDQPDSRNYVDQPIRIQRDVNKDTPCAVPCDECRSGRYCDTNKEEISMENIVKPYHPSPYSFTSMSFLNSDVPVPYYSWHDFGIMTQPNSEKTFFAAAFISNCQFLKRNDIVDTLIQRFPNRVDSYGKCLHNKEQTYPNTPEGKVAQLQTYLFSLAFENSETNDYITEKFFGTLASASVPVYLGAPNVKLFAPDSEDYPYESDALIRVRDYNDDPNQLAKVLKALDEDRDLYMEMLKWKKTGYTDDFKALMDLTDVHSSCRSCIYIADERRRRVGPNKFDVSTIKKDSAVSPANYFLYVRERGSYSFVEMAFTQPPISLVQLIRKILERVKRREINIWKNNDDLREWKQVTRVYGIYTINGRRPILSNEDLKALPDKAELEVIFV